jgi:hypothetical protein
MARERDSRSEIFGGVDVVIQAVEEVAVVGYGGGWLDGAEVGVSLGSYA